MNIQLFLSDQEVEMNDKVHIPLNRSYSSMANPTDILVDYSKSINIPMTKKNNKIFANAYRIDDIVVGGGDDTTNLGMYLDPSKRIPMKIIYNGTVLMDGYAKFISSTIDDKKGYYTINLFGSLGYMFQDLLSIVPSIDRLDGADEKFVMDKDEDAELDIHYVKKIFDTPSPDAWNLNNANAEDGTLIGFAPSHRGLYSNFESGKIQKNASDIIEISQYLNDIWVNKWKSINTKFSGETEEEFHTRALAFVEQLGAKDVVGEGIRDYVKREYRCEHLKPFLYFNRLMGLFSNKCTELTGYKMEFDKRWFNQQNPYWANMCYMLDPIDRSETKINAGDKILGPTRENNSYTASTSVAGTNTCDLTMGTITYDVTDNIKSSGITIRPLTINFGVSHTSKPGAAQVTFTNSKVKLNNNTIVTVTIKLLTKNTAGNWISKTTETFWTNGYNNATSYNPNNYDKSKFVTLEEVENSAGETITVNSSKGGWVKYRIKLPTISNEADFSNGLRVEVRLKYDNNVGVSGWVLPILYDWQYYNTNTKQWNNRGIFQYYKGTGSYGNEGMVYNAVDGIAYEYSISRPTFSDSIIPKIPVKLSTVYQKDEPLFNIILEYTKMFNLKWDVDYLNKIIKINTTSTLFDKIGIVDISSKIDMSKGMVIEHLPFDTKYLDFNYADVDGYIYKNYKNKYGFQYGEKLLNTGYEFNSDRNKLFDNIKPSSSSSRIFIPFEDWCNWDLQSILQNKTEQYVLLDSDSENENEYVSLNNWYLRGTNQSEVKYILTDSTSLMTSTNTECYLDTSYALSIGVGKEMKNLPLFSPVIIKDDKYYGCLFNTPYEDYTYDSSIKRMIGNDIYNLFWKSYINEMYDINNKKVTAYLYINIDDFNNFKINRFVTFDNQLFLVNKIMDFNFDDTSSTKVELIKINNPNNLKGKTFNSLIVSPESIWFDSMYDGERSELIAVMTTDTLSLSNITIDESLRGNIVIGDFRKPVSSVSTFRIDFPVRDINAKGNIYVKDSKGNEAIIPIEITNE